MNKIIKTISICLVAAVMLAAPMPLSALDKRPDGFNESRLWNKSSLGGGFILEIGDMAFRGYLTIAGDSEQFLDDMIKQVMDEMGIKESDLAAFERFLDNLFGKQDMTADDWDAVKGTLSDKLGISFDELVDAIGAIDAASNTDWEDAGWYAQGGAIIDDYLASGSDVAKKLNDYVRNHGLDSSSLFGDLSNFKESHDKWQGFNKDDPDYKLAMEAFKRREEFYSRLNKKIEEALRNGDGNYYYAIVFKDAKCVRQFTFDLEVIPWKWPEIWTLNMLLKLNVVGDGTSFWNPITTGNSYAEFTGDYTIDIEYDWGKLHEWVFVRNADSGIINMSVTEGSKSGKRTLTGEATAIVRVDIYHVEGGGYSISPTQKSDVKAVSISDIHLQGGRNTRETVLTCSGDNDNCITFYPHLDETRYDPWDDISSMYERGDNAKDGWVLTRWN